MQDLTALHTLVINSLEEQIAVIDAAGTIVDVNQAWINFGQENGLSAMYDWRGCNYLKILSASAASSEDPAVKTARGIDDVIIGKCDVYHSEYPCHSPDEKRWFTMRVARLKGDSQRLFVISHKNITLRKLAEERAEQLAMQDPLTGLANRRYFNLILKREIQRSIRNQSPISLVALDIDHFKDYNDEFGHIAGDKCLTRIGRVLLTFSRRPGDLAARPGGDEFTLILGDTDSAGSQKVAADILEAIKDLKMVFGESRVVTMSVGAATVVPRVLQNEELLLLEADKALYRAKSAGRDRIVHKQLVAAESA